MEHRLTCDMTVDELLGEIETQAGYLPQLTEWAKARAAADPFLGKDDVAGRCACALGATHVEAARIGQRVMRLVGELRRRIVTEEPEPTPASDQGTELVYWGAGHAFAGGVRQ